MFVVWGRKPTDEEIAAKAEERPGTAVPNLSNTAATAVATVNTEKPSDRNELPTKKESSRPGTAVPQSIQTNSRPGTAKGKNIERSIEPVVGEELPKEAEVNAIPDTTAPPSATPAREGSSELALTSMSLNDSSPKNESPEGKKI